MDKLLKEVLKRQKRTKLSDTKFAAKLGISRCTLESVVSGKRNAGYKFWSAVQGTYPELTDMVIEAMESRLVEAGKFAKRVALKAQKINQSKGYVRNVIQKAIGGD